MSFFKRLSVVLVAAALVFTVFASMSVLAAETTLAGDVNADGTVNILDVTYIQKVLIHKEPKPVDFVKVGDMNLDGEVSVKDATLIQMYIAKIINKLPQESSPEETTSVTQAETQAASATQPVTDDGWNPHIYRP